MIDDPRPTRPEPPDRSRQIEDLVAACIEASGDGDARRVEDLLRAQPELAVEARAQLDRLARSGLLADQPREIGPYRILEEIGAGGMGTVYRAEQREPVRRTVALKVVRAGMATKDVLARFALERRALAAMSHGCIAKVFDAGATARAEPYFVMEFVEGLPFTRYCDKHRLPLEGRLRLFQQVCNGVQHAHQKGIVHRDLKPGNVLVVREGDTAVPKILDFGLAKATNRDFLDATLFTEKDKILGTPEYMSPEQAAGDGEVIDARSDVYSLGVMLYEVLTGELPFPTQQLRRAGQREALRIIQEVEPPRPSTRITAVAPDRAAVGSQAAPTAPGFARALKGDLDWIVMRAMAKEPERRYDSATALAADLQRYLDHEPVLAGPPGAGYRLRKLLRRYRAQAIAASLVVLALIAGITGTSIGFARAVDSAKLATESGRTARLRAEEIGQQKAEIERQRQEIAARQARFDMLAHIVHLRTAKEREARLHPATPARLPDLRAWLADDARRAIDALPALRQTVATLAERALPRVPEAERAAQLAHPDHVRLQSTRARLEAWRRARAVRLGAPLADAPHLPATLEGATASALHAFAWPRVAFPTERTIYSEEHVGLAAARRALAAIDGGDASLPRWRGLDAVAWAELAVGRADEAIAVAREAIAAAPPAQQEDQRERLGGIERMAVTLAGPAMVETIAKLAAEATRLERQVEASRRYAFADESDRFLFDTLRGLIDDIEAFARSEVVSVTRRAAWAERVEELSITAHAARWTEARRALARADGISASTLYREPPIDLAPQLGLVPIGMNHETKLWEFYELRSAWDPASAIETAAALPIPQHDPATGAIAVGESTGIVFVLVPGGTFVMGAQAADADASDYDPAAGPNESPHSVTLAAFFVARHELTQGQWRRLSEGGSPSNYGLGRVNAGMPAPVTLAHPVELVDWEACNTLLSRHGLELPTEAQWEYACRAGTSTPWSSGSDVESLEGFVNLLDLGAKTLMTGWVGAHVTWDDGFLIHAPVGSLLPNPWGLYDVHGNVMEWTRDWFASYGLPVDPGDGLRQVMPGQASFRTCRGGAFDMEAHQARSAYRFMSAPAIRHAQVGVRAARAISPR